MIYLLALLDALETAERAALAVDSRARLDT